MDNQIPPFYVGQEVEAIVSHPHGAFTKGQRFIVKQIIKNCCGHSIDVGIKNSNIGVYCFTCKKVILDISEYWFFDSNRFRALTPEYEAISFSKVLEENLACQN